VVAHEFTQDVKRTFLVRELCAAGGSLSSGVGCFYFSRTRRAVLGTDLVSGRAGLGIVRTLLGVSGSKKILCTRIFCLTAFFRHKY
jgi:hypothetical protein